MSLSKLPPEVLSSVLNNPAITLGRRLRLRLLCNRWCDIIEDALKKKTSLVIRDENTNVHFQKPDDLIHKSTDQTDGFTRPLCRLFTSLTKLTISFGVEASLKAVPSLFAHLDTTSLTTVKLYSFAFCVDYEMIEPIAIADALAALPALTSLTLASFQISVLLLPHLKPVLSRLEKFGGLHHSGDIISSRLSPQCTHLWLDSDAFKSFNSPFLVELSSHLTHLHLLYCNSTIWQFISQMHALSSLELRFTGCVRLTAHLDSSFIHHLAPFTRLTDVKLYGLSYRTPLALPSKNLPPLPSIKRLTLGMDFRNSPVDYQAFFHNISAWVPNLVKVTVITKRGTIRAIQARLGKLSFSVELVDRYSDDTWAADW